MAADELISSSVVCTHFVGHETTSDTTAWLISKLGKPRSLHIQERLRVEISTRSLSKEPSDEELNALLYLDAVLNLKESLRANPVVL